MEHGEREPQGFLRTACGREKVVYRGCQARLAHEEKEGDFVDGGHPEWGSDGRRKAGLREAGKEKQEELTLVDACAMRNTKGAKPCYQDRP